VSLREFLDDSGTRWEVWEVKPPLIERRVLAHAPVDIDRRATPRKRPPVADDLRFGWLVFQNDAVKRRLAPVPQAWEGLDDAGLRELLGRATDRNRPRLALSGDDTLTTPPVRSVSSRLT
jgi:hypothetical protein